MNIREFCAEPGYRSALILTWSFDALFFERVVLPDLRAGGAGTVAVVADRRQTDEAMERWIRAAQQLGRRYVLDTATVEGHFHPKVILRMAPGGAYVWVGTGNVTAAGWGLNRELGAAWRVGPGQEDSGAWVLPLLSLVRSWTANVLCHEAIDRIRQEPWLAVEATNEPSTVLWTTPTATLASQLETRWRGRRFERVRLFTGSTDKAGQFFRWAHRTFGVTTATVILDADCASFDKDELRHLPVDVKFVAPGGEAAMHAKCYWFDGADGAAAVMGSANCSAAAWLRPVAQRGNVESIVVFDAVQSTEWRQILIPFDGPPLHGDEYLLDRATPDDNEAEDEARYRLLSVHLDADTGQIRASITPTPPRDATVTLVIDEEELVLVGGGAPGSWWTGPPPERLTMGRAAFATGRISDPTGMWVTRPRWIDQPRELREAARDRRLPSAFEGIGHATDASEHRRVLEDLQLAMDAILTDTAGFPDVPARRERRREDPEPAPDARRLDPQAVAVALVDANPLLRTMASSSSDLPPSLTGILHALFPTNDDDASYVSSPDLEVDEHEPSPGRSKPIPERPARHPHPRLTKKLGGQMERFLANLRDATFASRCTATQLVQAAAFPMGLAVLGVNSGWVDQATAQRWATSAATALLHEPVQGAEGLLGAVRRRYVTDNREDLVERIVGDGLLWALTATVLSGMKWDGLDGRLQRALLLRDVFTRPELSARVDPSQLRLTAARFRHGDAVAIISEELPRVNAALATLEAWLDGGWSSLLEQQAVAAGTHLPGDPLWRRGLGWVFATEAKPVTPTAKLKVRPWRPGQFRSKDPAVPASGYYVNVRLAIESGGPAAPRLP